MAERALVITPTYNERANVPTLIERVLAQDPRLEMLFVDDNSPDGTGDLIAEFASEEDMARADAEYFGELVREVVSRQEALETPLREWIDRPPSELDPVERAVLLIGVHELMSRPDVPWRVVINEAVGLTRRFGATDAHKYVNAVLDRAARALRPHEH